MIDTKSLLNTDFSDIKKKFSGLLVDIRKKLIFTILFFVSATLVGFVFYEGIISLIIEVLSLSDINIVFTSPFQFINLSISVGLATGLIVTFPILVIQILLFLKPALKRKEFRVVTRFLPFSLALFLIGFVFGAFIMKWQIGIFLTRATSIGIGNVLDISKLLSTIMLTSALMGIGFQFPIILILLMRLKVINHKELAKRRSWIYLGSFIFAILLPADSILADVFLSLPLIILFEIALIIGRINKRANPNTKN